MNFASIPGLQDVKSVLTEAVRNNHMAHAQLFVGAEGALNLPMALALATYLHCTNRGEDACGTCPACSRNARFVHPDTHFVFPFSNVKSEKDDERLKAEITKSWRSFLAEQPFGLLDDWTNYYGGEDKQALISREESREIIKSLSLKPFESQYKVMIIWQPELMHPSAANGILKILEEPPPHTYFILVTNAADRLLPTIISRTQIVTVPLLNDEDVEQYLVEKHCIEPSRAARVAQLADGNLVHAIRLLDKEEDNNAEQFVEWMRACFGRQYGALVSIADHYHGLDKLSQRNLLNYGIHMTREALLQVCDADDINRSRGEELDWVQKFSSVLDVKKIDRLYTLMNEASFHLERNGSAKMIFLDLSLKLAGVFKPIN